MYFLLYPMSNNPSPLIQSVTPEGFIGLSMDFIDAGFTGLVVKNGRVVRILKPGRYFNFALPILEQSQIILVDTKLRSLEIVSQGDFLSQDQFLINLSLNVIYQVIEPKRVAIEITDPIAALTSLVKDLMGIAIGQLSMDKLINQGRTLIREYMLQHNADAYLLGFSLEDIRVSDINFPQTRGIIRQVQGMSAREEEEYKAALKMQIAASGRPDIPQPPVQQVNIISNSSPHGNNSHQILPGKIPNLMIEQQAETPKNLPVNDEVSLPATILAPSAGNNAIARLVDRTSHGIILIDNNPFTIGREPGNNLVLQDPLSSRHHAKIFRIPDAGGNVQYQLIDLGSSNGTFIGGQRIIPHQPFLLSRGEVIKIGDREWNFDC